MDDDTAVAEREPAAGPADTLPALTGQLQADAGRGLLPAPLAMLQEVAQLMASSGPLVPEHVRNKPEVALALAYQAARWGMDPVTVAQKSYIANGRIGYEAQLVSSLINTRAPIREPLSIRYEGSGQKRYCVVTGYLKGSDEPRVVSSPTWGQIKVKNSPLWFSDPDQQFAYYTMRSWARRHCPQVILGVYTPEELQTLDVVTVATIRPDPYDEPPIEHIEVTVEPSGGDGWSPPAGGAKAKDNRHPNAPQDDGPSGGGETVEPDWIAEARAWLADRQAGAMKVDDPAVLEKGIASLTNSKNFKRIKAYDQALANTALRALEDRLATLKDDQFPGDRA